MTHLHPVNEAGNGANAADAAPRSRPTDRAAARLAASRFDRLSQATDQLVTSQLERWAHLIDFAQKEDK